MTQYGSEFKEDAEKTQTERVLLVGVIWPSISITLATEYLDELDMLAQTAGAEVVGRELAKRQRPDPATLLGKGKIEEIAEIATDLKADLVVFDEDLSPAQTRNLEKGIGHRIIDRAGLILDIFARRARSREAKTQVELAQLRYLLPRLTRAWTHLERQQGGIGMRGPGETQIETDRRIIRTRISVLEKDLEHVERVRNTQRAGRDKTFRFALAGYTNVGKSTLMNVLTSAGVYEENLLFATLDSTTRQLSVEGTNQKALLTDTVGFIRKLPPGLVASFRSTLAEISEADCIIHLVDLSSISWLEQKAEVDKILGEMGLKDRPQILAFNKIDALEDDGPRRIAERDFPGAVYLSAKQGSGVDVLQKAMLATMTGNLIEKTLKISLSDGARLAKIHSFCEVLQEEVLEDHIQLLVRYKKEDEFRIRER